MQDNKTVLSMINSVLHTDGFYFATDYDLTHTLQRLANTSPEFQEMSLLERVRHNSHHVGVRNVVVVFVITHAKCPHHSRRISVSSGMVTC